MLAHDTLLSARDAIASKKISSVELTRQALDRIDRLEPRILAFNSVFRERAVQQAQDADAGKRPGAERRADRDQGQPVHQFWPDHLQLAHAGEFQVAL